MSARMELLRAISVPAGDEFTVHVEGGPGNQLDWLCIRKTGAGNDDWLGWCYLNGTDVPPATDDGRKEAYVRMEAPDEPGEYVVTFHSNDTYDVYATMPFTVV